MLNLGMILLGCACVGMLSPMAMAADGEGDREKEPAETIAVVGHGKIGAAPDVAEISVGVVTEAAAAKDALAQNSDAMTALHKTIKEFGVASKDVQTVNLSLYPQYSQPRPNRPGANAPPRIVAYRAENVVRVTCRDISKLGRLLDTLTGSGANSINSISFRIDDDAKLLDEARKRAMADAKHTAELLAGEAGVVLGRPIRIREGGSSVPFPIAPMGRMMAAAAPAPVAPGEVETSVIVEVVYRLLPPK